MLLSNSDTSPCYCNNHLSQAVVFIYGRVLSVIEEIFQELIEEYQPGEEYGLISKDWSYSQYEIKSKEEFIK